MRFSILPLHVSQVLRLPRKSDAKSYKVLHLSSKIIQANLKIWFSKMQPISGNQRPDRRTCLTHVSLALRLPRETHLCRASESSHACQHSWNCYKTLMYCSLLARCRIPCACHKQRCFNITIPKSASKLRCFVHFDLEMCFARQRCATFHLSSG